MLSIGVIDQLMNTLHIKTNILVIVSLTLLFLGCSSQSQIQYPDATFSQENIEIPKEQIEDVESKKIEPLATQDSVSLEDSKIMPSAFSPLRIIAGPWTNDFI